MSWTTLAILMTISGAAILSPAFGAPAFVAFTPGIPLGLAGVIACARLFMRGRASRNWTSVQCRILSSSVEERVTMGGDGSGGDNIYWTPRVRFEFAVAGKRYDGVESGDGMSWSNDRKPAEKFTARFPSGRNAVAYYNPENPSDCCLVPGETRGALLGLAISLLLTVAFSGVVYILWKIKA